MNISDHRWQRALIAFSFLSLVLFTATFTIAPLNGEDYALTRLFGDAGIAERLVWVLARSHVQITEWNARLGEQLSILWLSMPKVYFILAATSFFVLFNALVALTFSGRTGWPIKSAISVSLLFLFWPGLEVFFWDTANAGFFQPITLTMLCFVFYTSQGSMDYLLGNKLRLALVCLLALLAGLSFENTPVAVVIFMLISFYQMEGKVSRRLALLPPLAMVAGWLILVTADSTAIRRAHYSKVFGFTGYNMDFFAMRTVEVTRVFFTTSGFLFLAACLAFTYVYLQSIRRPRLLLLILPAILTVGSVVAAPYTEPRAFAFAWTLMFAVIVEAVYQISKKYPEWRIILISGFFVSLLFQLKSFNIYADFSEKMATRDLYIKSKLYDADCATGIAVAGVKTDASYRYLNNRDEWYQQNPEFLAKYYGCKVLIK